MADEKEVAKVDVKALFGEFDLADAAWAKAKEETEAAYRLRSDICERIAKAIAPETKVLRRVDGQQIELTLVCRSVKQDDGTSRDTWFIRSPRKDGKKLLEV